MLFLLVVILVYSGVVHVHASSQDLYCTQIVYDGFGHVYVEATLAACVAAMSAPLMPVSYNLLYDGNLTVTNQLSLNNIVNVNEGIFDYKNSVYISCPMSNV